MNNISVIIYVYKKEAVSQFCCIMGETWCCFHVKRVVVVY